MLSKLEKNRWKQQGLQQKHKNIIKYHTEVSKLKNAVIEMEKNALDFFNSNVDEAE